MRLIFLSTHTETALVAEGTVKKGRRDDPAELISLALLFRQGVQAHCGAAAALPSSFLPKTDMWNVPVQTQRR